MAKHGKKLRSGNMEAGERLGIEVGMGRDSMCRDCGPLLKAMKLLQIEMPDGSVWQVPASLIEKNYSDCHDGDELLDGDHLMEWAENNMNWDEVKHAATRIKCAPPVDCQDGWVNGEKRVVDV